MDSFFLDKTNKLKPTTLPGRRTIVFSSQHETIHSWLYLPKHQICAPPPLVVVGNGFCLQKDICLPIIASGLAKEGFAVLSVDYRFSGGSTGQPRNKIVWQHQLEDFQTAVAYARAANLGGKVNASNLALLGVSYGGGHALVTASKLGDSVKAVVAVEPFTSAQEAIKANSGNSGWQMLRVVALAASDFIRSYLQLPTIYLPPSRRRGDPGLSLAVLEDAEMDAFMRCLPNQPLGGYRNLVPASVIWHGASYMPIHHVKDIKAPTLFLAGGADRIIPADSVKKAAAVIANRSKYIEYPSAMHFTIFEEPSLIRDIASFLRGHMSPLAEEAVD